MSYYPKTERVKKLFHDFGTPDVRVDMDWNDWEEKDFKVFCLHETTPNPLTGQMEPITPWFRSKEELEDFLVINMPHYEAIVFDLYFNGTYPKGFRWFWL